MIRNYKALMTAILLIVFLSILKVDNWIDTKITNYNVLAFKSLFFHLTRLNWQYGFFTSKSDKYQYIKSDIYLGNESSNAMCPVTKNGSIACFGSPANSLRLNTSIQQITRDSIYLEAGTKSMALYLFNKIPEATKADFIIKLYNCSISRKNERLYIHTSIDTFFNRTLSY